MELDDDVVVELRLYLHDRGPENGSGPRVFCCPKGRVRVVFGLEYSSEHRVFVRSNIASSM